MKTRFLVFQLTARRKYDVAEILFKERKLKYLVTDFYVKNGFVDNFILFIEKSFTKFRNNNILDSFVLRSFLSGLLFRVCIRFFSKKNFNKSLIIASKVLLNSTSIRLKKSSFTHIYAFDTGAFHIFKKFKKSKELILEQCVAPRSSQIKMYNKLSKNYNLNLESYIQNCKNTLYIEFSELRMASKIVCPSLYVKDELIKHGVDDEVIRIVPYGFNNPISEKQLLYNISKKNTSKDFNILFVGNEAIRKGVIDILQVAREFEHDKRVRFHLVGDISDELEYFKITDFPSNVKIHGKLLKDKLFQLYLKSSLFFMPSYLEGSALVNYEALSFGIPLLTTFESGSVIENAIHGYVVKTGDTIKMIEHISKLLDDKKLNFELSKNAYNLSKNFTLYKYKERLISALK